MLMIQGGRTWSRAMFTKLASANWEFTMKPIAGVYNACLLASKASCGYKIQKDKKESR